MPTDRLKKFMTNCSPKEKSLTPAEFNIDRYKDYNYFPGPERLFTSFKNLHLFKAYKLLSKYGLKNSKLLNIGCGNGDFLLLLKNQGFITYGIDISPQAGKVCKNKGLDVISQDVEKGIPFPDNFFQITIAAEVIEHIYD